MPPPHGTDFLVAYLIAEDNRALTLSTLFIFLPFIFISLDFINFLYLLQTALFQENNFVLLLSVPTTSVVSPLHNSKVIQ